jgi:hypothetical protein
MSYMTRAYFNALEGLEPDTGAEELILETEEEPVEQETV